MSCTKCKSYTVVHSSPFVSPLPSGKVDYFSEGFSKIPQNGATKDTGFQPTYFQQALTWSDKEDPRSTIEEKLHQAGQWIADGFLHVADLIVHRSGQVQKR